MKKNPYKGKLICFEGIDGSGKSSQVGMLHADLISKKDLNTIFTKEPTGDPIGRTIYAILERRHEKFKLENMTELDMQRLYFQNRRNHYQDLVLPAVRGGINVMSDRGMASVAFGLKDSSDLSRFLSIEDAMFEAKKVMFIIPDLILIYDVDVDTALDRLSRKEGDNDLFERKEVLMRTRANYIAISKIIPNCIIIDGTPPAEEVYKETKHHVSSVLGINI